MIGEAANVRTVSVRELGGTGTELGRGGQGVVMELPARPGFLLKRYLDGVAVDAGALRAIVAWREALPGTARRQLDAATAWPVAVLNDDDGPGVVFRRAPERFVETVEGTPALRELQFAYCETARWAGVEPVGPAAAVELVRRYATVLALLHRYGASYPDLSHVNLLWASRRGVWVFLIDCDSACLANTPPALGRAETALWEYPWGAVESFADAVERDRFKLALLFLRCYFHSTIEFTASTRRLAAPKDPPLTREVGTLLRQGLRREGPRPTPEVWIGALGGLGRALRRRGIG